MSHTDDRYIKNLSFPAWLVYLIMFGGSGLILTLLGTIGGVIVKDREQLHTLNNRVSVVEANAATNKVHQEEAFNDIAYIKKALAKIEQDVTLIKQRMP